MVLARLLRSQELLLAGSIALGLLWPGPAELLRPAMLPTLGVVLFLSFLAIPPDLLTRPGPLLRDGLQAVGLSFGVLAALILGLSHLLFTDPHFRTGYVFLAAAPPASAVLSLTPSLGPQAVPSQRAVLGGYLASLVLTPLVILLFGDRPLPREIGLLMAYLALLILLPLAASRAVHSRGWQARLHSAKGGAIKWLFFLVFFVLAGVNRNVLLHEFDMLWRSALIGLSTFLGLGGAILLFSRRRGASRELSATRALLATCKNTGMAGGLVLSLAGAREAAPCVVAVVFMLAFVSLMRLYLRPGGDGPP